MRECLGELDELERSIKQGIDSMCGKLYRAIDWQLKGGRGGVRPRTGRGRPACRGTPGIGADEACLGKSVCPARYDYSGSFAKVEE
ncbi:hypothetical protein [Microbispora catharanthi]|uniref:Uncharacterized protein n=1 Tax=Microbispora catharanthi TaxID=1712871 RepID=A0A5N6C6P1_9ACTN|nr:hypothetical protein [Microbispora catharanthi]KAB8188070.1 hypothetical protein FH610_002835 [Microbispora catharanthi]